MEKVCPCCGQPSDRGRLKNRTEQHRARTFDVDDCWKSVFEDLVERLSLSQAAVHQDFLGRQQLLTRYTQTRTHIHRHTRQHSSPSPCTVIVFWTSTTRPHTHTRARLTVLRPWLPGCMSRFQKGKTNLDFTAARDSEWQWHQLGHMQVCTSLQTDNHASSSPLKFYTSSSSSSSSHLRCQNWTQNTEIKQCKIKVWKATREATAHWTGRLC